MSPLPLPKGTCPVCGRWIDVGRRSGVLRWHRSTDFPKTDQEWKTCAGAGQPPKAAS